MHTEWSVLTDILAFKNIPIFQNPIEILRMNSMEILLHRLK